MKIETNSAHEQEQIDRSKFANDFENEIEKLNLENLKTVLKKLNFLSFEVDPYDVSSLKAEEENILNEFKLSDSLTNPFEYTNKVLMMIDLVESKINIKYH